MGHNSATIKLVTPANVEGTVDVTVVNSDEQSVTLTGAYQFKKIDVVDNTGSSSGSGGGGSLDVVSIIIMWLLMVLQKNTILRRKYLPTQPWPHDLFR